MQMQRTPQKEGEKKTADKKQTRTRKMEKEREKEDQESKPVNGPPCYTFFASQATREHDTGTPKWARKRRRASHQDLTGQANGGN